MCIEKQNTYYTAYDRFIILLNNNSATSQHFHDDQIAIVELLENVQLCSCIVPFKSKLTVRCESRFSIATRIKNRDSRTSYVESSRRSSLAGQKTEDSPITDFLKILQRHTAVTQQHGYTCISKYSQKQLLLETRPIQVIKGMFLQGHLYHVSFPQVKFQMPAP